MTAKTRRRDHILPLQLPKTSVMFYCRSSCFLVCRQMAKYLCSFTTLGGNSMYFYIVHGRNHHSRAVEVFFITFSYVHAFTCWVLQATSVSPEAKKTQPNKKKTQQWFAAYLLCAQNSLKQEIPFHHHCVKQQFWAKHYRLLQKEENSSRELKATGRYIHKRMLPLHPTTSKSNVL